MNNSVITFPVPANEPVKAYLAGSPERVALEKELERQSKLVVDIPIIIGGKEIRTGDVGKVTCPHDHNHVLATYHKVTKKEIKAYTEAIREIMITNTPNPKIMLIGLTLKEEIPLKAKASIFFKGYLDSPAARSLRE